MVPYKIGNEEFHKTYFYYVLVDGIYPNYSRFVKSIKEPIEDDEKKFTAWQEACRKDIERAFGVLQSQWQWIARPIHLHKLEEIADRVACCILLHNINVSDRVMGDVNVRYKPDESLEEEQLVALQSTEALNRQEQVPRNQQSEIGLDNMTDPAAINLFTTRQEWKELNDPLGHLRLQTALMKRFK